LEPLGRGARGEEDMKLNRG